MTGPMEFGVFLPIGNNGWIISETSPQYRPSFALNRRICQRAEAYGLDFALSMVKFRGYGGTTEHWDHAQESLALMAALAPVTSSIELYATIAVVTVHPAIVARMAATIDDVSGGRFGLNIVSGWNKLEYSQMSLWPGDEHYGHRYDYSTEYVTIMKELWANGRSSFQGRFFQLDDCLCQPTPSRQIPIVAAGQSEVGMRFGARLADHNFIIGTAAQCGRITSTFKAMAAEEGRRVGTYALMGIVTGDTTAEAVAKAQLYLDGADTEAVLGMAGAASADTSGSTAAVLTSQLPTPPTIEFPTSGPLAGAAAYVQGSALMVPNLIGDHGQIARYLDVLAAEGVDGVILTFPEFISGVTDFGERIMPLMTSRAGRSAAAVALG